MAKVGDPVWSYGGSAVLTSVDFGTTTQPEWSYGGSVLQNSMPTAVDVVGTHFTYGQAKLLTSEHTSDLKTVSGDFEPEWYYGASTLLHKLVERILGGRRAKWLASFIARRRM